MRTHTNDYKNNIKKLGREIDVIVSYILDEEEITLQPNQINSITPYFKTRILKSAMKQLDIDCNVSIPKDTIISFQFGIKVGNNYEYIDFGDYIVTNVEEQKDTRSYKITCYDMMIKSMVNYENIGVEYPMTIKNYINQLCVFLGLEFKNINDDFVNSDKLINKELFLNQNGESLGFTFRDVLDQLAEVTASIICIDNNNKLEIRYINDTNDTIDEKFLKNVNVEFGEKFGPVNSIVLSRSADSDSIYLQDEGSVEENGLTEIKISENQFMNFNDRDTFLPAILNELDGLEFYLNDFSSTGITYYEVADKYNIQIGENIYPCIMFEDEIIITKGLEENVTTELPDNYKTDYSKADKTDRKLNQTTLIVDKQQGTIEGLVSEVSELNGVVNENFTRIYQDITNVITNVQTSGGSNLLKNSVMFGYNELGEPNDWDSNKETINYNNEQVLYNNEEINFGGIKGLTIQNDTEAINAGGISGHSFTLNDNSIRQRIIVTANSSENNQNYYTFSTRIKKNVAGNCYIKIYNENEEYKIELNNGQSAYYDEFIIQSMHPTMNYFIIEFYGSDESGATFTDNMFALGQYKTQWQQANGEIMNTQVVVDINGMKVQSSIYEGNETVITPLEFAGYAMVNGVKTKVFTLNNDTTEVEKLKVRKEIKMPPIKILPITTGNKQGWAFIPSGGDN